MKKGIMSSFNVAIKTATISDTFAFWINPPTMAPQSIAIGLVAVDEAGRDGELLKKVLPYAALFIIISALVCFFGQYVWAIFGIA